VAYSIARAPADFCRPRPSIFSVGRGGYTNAGRIESGDGYKFYAEGVTPAVARLYEAINEERVAVAAALGASVPTLADWFDRVYGVREATLVETCQRLTYNSDGPYQATGTPKSLDHKFTTEDVPTGLIPMSALGAPAGVATPAIDALVELVRKMTGKDFVSDARTLERLGLSGMDAPQIRRVMDEGFI
jgi:opine dehydrogenase